MVGRDRDRFSAVSFLNKGAELTELTFVYKNSAGNIDYLLYECFKMRNLGVVSLNYARPPFRWVVFKAAAKSARAASVREV